MCPDGQTTSHSPSVAETAQDQGPLTLALFPRHQMLYVGMLGPAQCPPRGAGQCTEDTAGARNSSESRGKEVGLFFIYIQHLDYLPAKGSVWCQDGFMS